MRSDSTSVVFAYVGVVFGLPWRSAALPGKASSFSRDIVDGKTMLPGVSSQDVTQTACSSQNVLRSASREPRVVVKGKDRSSGHDEMRLIFSTASYLAYCAHQ